MKPEFNLKIEYQCSISGLPVNLILVCFPSLRLGSESACAGRGPSDSDSEAGPPGLGVRLTGS